uniref:Pentapeptide MXKDX repeat protein n=1 Tax=Caenorhabditis tropicalis TaxID=1561998 RepID=A0A1I7UGD5_9PELO
MSDQHRCEKMEHKGHGMDFGDLHNMDDKKQMDAMFQEKRHGMDGDCKSGGKCDEKLEMKKTMDQGKKECEGKKDCGMKDGGCH